MHAVQSPARVSCAVHTLIECFCWLARVFLLCSVRMRLRGAPPSLILARTCVVWGPGSDTSAGSHSSILVVPAVSGVVPIGARETSSSNLAASLQPVCPGGTLLLKSPGCWGGGGGSGCSPVVFLHPSYLQTCLHGPPRLRPSRWQAATGRTGRDFEVAVIVFHMSPPPTLLSAGAVLLHVSQC